MWSRRQVLSALGGSAAAIGLGPTLAAAREAGQGIKAVGFDAFTIFDPRSVTAVIEAAFPGRGEQLGALWRGKIFEYCWLRTLSGRYADFWQIANESLPVAFATAKLELPAAARATLMDAWLHLKPWPDSLAALRSMHDAGVRLAYLSNFNPTILKSISEGAGIADLFEHQLSTDRVQAYKPDPRAYAMAETAFKLPRSTILFAAFGGWDAGGAKSFGLETFWVNRFAAPGDTWGPSPDGAGHTLDDLARYVVR